MYGAYVIRHPASGCFYIGSTENYPRRRSKHETDLRYGRHHCQPLLQVYRLDSALTWDFFPTNDRESAYRLEQELIDRHRNDPLLCNVYHSVGQRDAWGSAAGGARISEKNSGRTHSAESRARMSVTRQGRPPPPQATAAMVESKRLPVSIDGIVYSTASEASRATGVAVKTVLNRARNAGKKYNNYAIVEKA